MLTFMLCHAVSIASEKVKREYVSRSGVTNYDELSCRTTKATKQKLKFPTEMRRMGTENIRKKKLAWCMTWFQILSVFHVCL
jgi:hypothetical protein